MAEIPWPSERLSRGGIVLRPWRADDVPRALEATRDPLIPYFTTVPENQTLEGVQAHYEGREADRLAGRSLDFVIAGAADDSLLGVISLLRMAWEELRGEIGYWLAPWGRGRGAMVNAIELLSRWSIESLGLLRVEIFCDRENVASQRAAERAGFTRDGVLRSYEFAKHRRRIDVVMYSLLPEDLDGGG